MNYDHSYSYNKWLHTYSYLYIQYIYIDGNTDPQIMQHLHEVIKLKKQTLGNVIYYQFYLNITYHHLLIMIITSHHHHLYKHLHTYLIYICLGGYTSAESIALQSSTNRPMILIGG